MVNIWERKGGERMAKWSKGNLELLRDANERLLDWEGMENVPNDVKMYRDMLRKFYEDIGKNPKNPEGFSVHVKLTRAQQSELAQIAEKVTNKWTTDLQQYEWFMEDPTRQRVREEYNINTLDAAIDFLDTMEHRRNEAWLVEALSSSQVKELYDEARDKGLSGAEADNLIYMEYQGGLTSEEIYDQIWESIQSYDEKIQGWSFD
jgi:hypothetical protein